MTLKPINNHLIVRPMEADKTTASGILLPDSARDKPQKGTVLSVGPGRIHEETGKRIPLEVSVGEQILYSKYGGTEIKADGEDLLIIDENGVLARISA